MRQREGTRPGNIDITLFPDSPIAETSSVALQEHYARMVDIN